MTVGNFKGNEVEYRGKGNKVIELNCCRGAEDKVKKGESTKRNN